MGDKLGPSGLSHSRKSAQAGASCSNS